MPNPARTLDRIVVIGASGQVGRALTSLLGPRQAVALTRLQADLSQPNLLIPILENVRPSAVINASAYTRVDQAEQEEELAFKVNAEAPGIIAKWCASRNVPFVQYSTDYVFSGAGSEPWKESDVPSPLNAYGRTKRAGEVAVEKSGGKYLILRTSWVYAETGANFLRAMLQLGKECEELRVVADQVGAPTYAYHLAQATLDALESALEKPQFPSGIFHLCNEGETTWHGFAVEIFKEARKKGMPMKVKDVKAIASADYPTAARRPVNSRLRTDKALEVFGLQLPHWREGLHECMTRMDDESL